MSKITVGLRWALMTPLGLAALCVLSGQAQAVGISSSIGSTSFGSAVATYVVAADGTLRSRDWSGSWLWVNHGFTTNGSVVAAPIGVTNDGRNPFAFVKGSDGNIWESYGPVANSWANIGTPPGVSVSSSVGATLHKFTWCGSSQGLGWCYQYNTANNPVAYIVGNDGNLWGWGATPHTVNGSTTWTYQWQNHGVPNAGVAIAKAIGALTVYSGYYCEWYYIPFGSCIDFEWRPYTYVIGSDGKVWSRWWNGSVWQWTNHGSPSGGVAEGVGVTVIGSGTRPFVFVKGNDGNLWSLSWTNSTWVWYNHGKPGGLSISQGMGATCANTCGDPFAFVKAADGNMWTMSWQRTYWKWTNHGTPSGVGIRTAVGAIAINDNNQNDFFVGSDGNLWVRYWSGSAWGWTNMGQP